MLETYHFELLRDFTDAKFAALMADLHPGYDPKYDFRVAETPVMMDADFRREVENLFADVKGFLEGNDLHQMTDRAIPAGGGVSGDEGAHPYFLCLDFAVCRDAEGRYYPQVIELQGVASLFVYESFLAEAYRKYLGLPDSITPYWQGFDQAAYLDHLRQFLLGGADPETVVMLDIQPFTQKTRIDFIHTQQALGIQPVCVTEMWEAEGKLFYEKNGRAIPISRIYNRLIPDEFERKKESLTLRFDYYNPPAGTQWLSHPNWFYRVSKYLMPFMNSRYVPETHFLDQLAEMPDDLENWVLKPLFSFAGAGVVFDVTPQDIEAVPAEQRNTYMLQRKVEYAAFVPTLDRPAKTEVRILCIWTDEGIKPMMNLARLSKGKMLGVDFNKDQTWVGGSAIFWE